MFAHSVSNAEPKMKADPGFLCLREPNLMKITMELGLTVRQKNYFNNELQDKNRAE